MKKIIFALVASVSFVAMSENAAPDAATAGKKVMTAEEKEARRKVMLERTGGIVDIIAKGRIQYVNCQKRIPVSTVADRVAEVKSTLRVNIELSEGAWKLGDALPEGANAAIYIVDDPTLPLSLVAVESRWGVLNVAKLGDNARFGKAFARVTILTLGGWVSQYKSSPMQPVGCVEDLDKLLADVITIDSSSSMLNNLKVLGVTQARKTTYRKACIDGVAEAPTNDYQKVIWEEVHAKPTNPMKIKFDPKKGE